VPELISPDLRVHHSFLAAMAEFEAEGQGGPDDDSNTGQAIRKYARRWADPAGFARYLRELEDQARDESPRPDGRVPQTTLWWVSGNEYLGRISIRHRLTASLREIGGHIGYDIRPSARQRGYATAMLAAALPVARSLGIDRALLTCDEDNLASRKVIEANGGVLEGKSGDKVRLPASPRDCKWVHGGSVYGLGRASLCSLALIAAVPASGRPGQGARSARSAAPQASLTRPFGSRSWAGGGKGSGRGSAVSGAGGGLSCWERGGLLGGGTGGGEGAARLT
jgi:predicted acetyltransferase